MSVSIKNNRISLYFSPRKDKDLIDEFDGVSVGDVSWFIKELMRDGIKYRKGGNPVIVAPEQKPYSYSAIPNPSVPSGASFESLMDMEVQKKELSDDEAEDMFDKL